MASGGGEEAGGQACETRRQDGEANAEENSGARAKSQDRVRRQRPYVALGACLVRQVRTEPAAATSRELRMVLRVAICALALAIAEPAFTLDLPQQRIVPGGVATIELGAAPTRPSAHVGDVPVLVVGEPSRWVAVLGIALAASPGRQTLVVKRSGAAERKQTFVVEPTRYAEQQLKVSGK